MTAFIFVKMSIQLNHIIPVFLEKEKILRSEVWKQELVFKKGERIQVVAPSGSGKTSLVHFMYGMRKDYEGNIVIDNKNLHEYDMDSTAEIRATRMSIIFQDLRLFRDFTARENLEVKRSLSPFHTNSKIDEMAARLGIQNKLSQKAGTCSYGEQQRIAIIRALQQPFDFLIMDEPFSHLDENNGRKAMELIEEEAAVRGAGIILADLGPVPFFNASRTLHL